MSFSKNELKTRERGIIARQAGCIMDAQGRIRSQALHDDIPARNVIQQADMEAPRNDSDGEPLSITEQIEKAKAEVSRLAEALGGSAWERDDGALEYFVPDPPAESPA